VAGNRLDKILCRDVAMLTTQLPDNYFDAIICNGVLEHLIDPYSVLEGLKKLSRNGVIVSSIPNIRYFRNLFDFVFKKNWDFTKEGIMDFTHFRFFTVNGIRKMYETLNFEMVKMEGIHSAKSLRLLLLSLFTFGSFSEIKYLQFVTVAKLKKLHIKEK
jgi:2-polyprenyl-3-methyl-5-hydroxy-6-metoxy-1,4-benzoquinol methylase